MKFLTKNVNLWKTVDRLFVKIANAWKPATAVWFKQAGAWIKIYSSVFSIQFPITTQGWNYDPANGQSIGGDVALVNGLLYFYRGGQFHVIAWAITGSITNITGYLYQLVFDSPPTWTGSIKITNINTGVSITLPKLNATTWQTTYPNDSSPHVPVPVNPREQFIRNMPAEDTYKLEDA
jgi:hypothetical protein